MYFDIVKGCPIRKGELMYIKDEYSINFLPDQGGGYTVVVTYLNVDFDTVTHCATQVWGLHPHTAWIEQTISPPAFQSGGLTFDDPTINNDNDVVRIDGSLEWPSFYDKHSGWLCVGNPQPENDDHAVEFATNTIAVLHNNQFKALWLKPSIYQTHPSARKDS